MRILLILTALTVLLSNSATKAQTYMATGSGNFSCGSWTASRHAFIPGGPATSGFQIALQDQAWVLGFLSGIGFVGDGGDNPLDGVDADGVWAWIDNYCQGNPIEKISHAAAAFYRAHPHR